MWVCLNEIHLYSSFLKWIKVFCLVLISLCRSFINYQVLTYLLYIVIHPAQWELQEQGLMLFLFLLPSCSCYYQYRSQEACVSKLFSSGGKSQTMPAMRCNRASLMQSKIHQFNTMEASLTLNIGKALPLVHMQNVRLQNTSHVSFLEICRNWSCNGTVSSASTALIVKKSCG